MSFDIPDGSVDPLTVSAHGGDGGAGGAGGGGGDGGSGGDGGNGGDASDFCAPGNGGDGGDGGDGAPGAAGGSGANGGAGGSVQVTYPNGYDAGLISIDVDGGRGGSGGSGGSGGQGGTGGIGGLGGFSFGDGESGQDGNDGFPGNAGADFPFASPSGSDGTPGSATLVQRADPPSVPPPPPGHLVQYTPSGPFWQATDVTALAGGPTLLGRPKPLPVGTATEVYATDAANHLRQYAGAPDGTWHTTDLSTVPGGVPVAGVPTPVSTGTDRRVYAIAAGTGHLVEWAQSLAGGPWRVTDVSATVGFGTALRRSPSAVYDRTAVHVLAIDSGNSLSDFAGTGTAWRRTDLTAATGTRAVGDPAAFEYGGNSIQVAETSPGAHLVLFVEGLTGGTPSVWDLTAMTGGTTFPASDASVALYGATNEDVQIFADGGPGRLVQWFKAPNPAPWQVYDLTPTVSLEGAGQTPSTYTAGADVYTYVRRADGHLLQWFKAPNPSPWQVRDITALAGGAGVGAGGPAVAGAQQVFAISG